MSPHDALGSLPASQSPSEEEDEFPLSKRQKPEASLSAEEPQNTIVPSLNDIANAPDMTILVGPSSQPFHLHKSLIVPKSPMLASFCRAVASPFFQKFREITLPELSPYSFRIILSYLENGRSSLKELKTAEDILQAYEAADYLIIKEMKGEILEYVVQVVEDDARVVDGDDDDKGKVLPFESNVLRELCVFSQKSEFEGLVRVLQAYVEGDPGLLVGDEEPKEESLVPSSLVMSDVALNGESKEENDDDDNDDDEEDNDDDEEDNEDDDGEEDDTLGLELYLEVWDEVLKRKKAAGAAASADDESDGSYVLVAGGEGQDDPEDREQQLENEATWWGWGANGSLL
ncbi:hypothetical protein TWF506_004392 [Arthrobotrys conoides]|uniref:BTB domain-containing protein n=1 Tax=Arthrobotrys conoides TaxID=74498 RepID=A0AAN8N0M2_9PEZI